MATELWNVLRHANRKVDSETRNEVTVIISAESQAVLQEFLTKVLQIDDVETSLASMGYYHKSLGKQLENGCVLDLHIYTVAWPLTSMDLDLLSIFVKPDACSIKWVFLLDWLQGNKKLWLRDLHEALELVRHKLGRDPCDIDSCSIITMQSQCCKDLEISSASWSSLKMEFMNQALRSLAMHMHASLMALASTTNTEDLNEVCKVVVGKETLKSPEYIELSKLFIPKDCDSEGKIKTMGEEFPVSQVLQETFISGHYERLIPGELRTEVTYLSDTPKSIAESDVLNIQKELAEIYTSQKVSLLKTTSTETSTVETLDAEESIDV